MVTIVVQMTTDATSAIAPDDDGEYASLVSDFTKALGRAVEFARRRRGWTQDQLADRADLNRGYLGGIERGERNPTLDIIVKLAAALDMRLSDLIAAAEEERGR
jgi:DNA-binding XRE family transcriptional regulator